MKSGVRDILAGIDAYKEQQAEILAAIENHGGRLTQDEFDKAFGNEVEEVMPNGERVIIRKPPKLRVWSMSRGSFVLGGMGDARSASDWGKMLSLAQLMARAGFLRIEGRPPNVVYVVSAVVK